MDPPEIATTPAPDGEAKPKDGYTMLIELLVNQVLDDMEREARGELPPQPQPSPKPKRVRRRPRALSDHARAEMFRCVLPTATLLKLAVPAADRYWPRGSGVYFLISDNKVMYVGSTRCLRERLAAHQHKSHTHIAWIETDCYLELESIYIRRLAPPWNGPGAPTISKEMAQLVKRLRESGI